MKPLVRVALSLSVLASLFVGTLAGAAEPCTDASGKLVFNELKQYIKAPEHKLGNLGATDFGDFPTWNGIPPSQSIQGGAGGGSFAARYPFNPSGTEYDPKGSARFEGAFTGCIDTIAWDLYLLSPLTPEGVPPSGDWVQARVNLVIDGTHTYRAPIPDGPMIHASSEGPGLYHLRFVFRGLHAAMKARAAQYAPLEAGHTIELAIFPQSIGEAQGAFVFDTTEAPSNLTFNKTDLSLYSKIDLA
jgi:hypothetical protein